MTAITRIFQSPVLLVLLFLGRAINCLLLPDVN